eukprot:gene9332-19374_t
MQNQSKENSKTNISIKQTFNKSQGWRLSQRIVKSVEMGSARAFTTMLLPIFASTVNGFRFPLPLKLFSTDIRSSVVEDSAEKISVFVGNLPIEASEDQLKSFFQEKIGSSFANLRMPTDRKTGRSRGFIYLEFDEQSQAESALGTLTGAVCMDRPIKVDMAESRKARPESERTERPRRDSSSFVAAPQENSIYVGNLDFATTESDLTNLCDSVLGEGQAIKVRIAMDRVTNRAKGFAHIDFVSEDAAKRAVAELNQTILKDREIRVDYAQRKEDRLVTPRANSFSRTPGAGGGRPQEEHSVFIGNLAWDMTSELVEEMVNDVLGNGLYKKVRLAVDRETGRSRGFGHIDFKDDESAQRAISELNGMEVLGRQLRVDRATRREEGASGGGDRQSGGRGRSNSDGRRYDKNESPDNYGSFSENLRPDIFDFFAIVFENTHTLDATKTCRKVE